MVDYNAWRLELLTNWHFGRMGRKVYGAGNKKKEKCLAGVGLPLQRLGACCEVALCMTGRIHSFPGPLLIHWHVLV